MALDLPAMEEEVSTALGKTAMVFTARPRLSLPKAQRGRASTESFREAAFPEVCRKEKK